MQALGILSGTVIQGEENKLSPLSYRPLLLVRRATPEGVLDEIQKAMAFKMCHSYKSI